MAPIPPDSSRSTSEIKREYPWINVLKLLCALMVVHIHVPVPYQPYILPVCTIAVPVFFIISGYFLADDRGVFDLRHIRKSIPKTAKIMAFALMLYFAVIIVSNYRNGLPLKETFLNARNWIEMVLFGSWPHEPLWYLTALLEAFAVILLISRFKTMEKLRDLALMIALSLVLQTLVCYLMIGPGITDHNRYLAHTFLWPALPCLAIGTIIRRIKKLPDTKAITACIAILIIVLYLLDYYRDLSGGLMHIQCQTVAVALAAMVFVAFLKLGHASKTVWTLAALGRNHTRNIYIVHSACNLIVINIAFILPESMLAVTTFAVSLFVSAGWNNMQRMKKRLFTPAIR